MKKYWKSIEEKENGDDVRRSAEASEIREKNDMIRFIEDKGDAVRHSRRDFLKYCGFGFATAAMVSSCKNPVNKAIPYLIKPEDVNPGTAVHYASTYWDGTDYAGILVKVRDGRPVKIEGNDLSEISMGGTNARTQASILGLYNDAGRIRGPLKDGKSVSWETADREIIVSLREAASGNKGITLLTSTIISPTLNDLIREFRDTYPGTRHISYDPISMTAMRMANEVNFGEQSIPSYHFDKADIIVGFNADFLGTWLSPVEYTRQYSTARTFGENRKTMPKHYQFESYLSLTGSNADKRTAIRPSEEKVILANLCNEIAGLSGNQKYDCPPAPFDLGSLARELWERKGAALVVCGTNDLQSQMLTNAINFMLSSYDRCIDLGREMYTRQGADQEMTAFVDDLHQGKVSVILMFGVNPAYDYREPAKFTEGLKKTGLSVSFAHTWDETARLSKFVCPLSHYLESWDDACPRKGSYSLAQPAINKLFDTRTFAESLLKYLGRTEDSHSYIRSHWEKNIHPLSGASLAFDRFWNKVVQEGVFNIEVPSRIPSTVNRLAEAFTGITDAGADIELVLYEAVQAGNGIHAGNPWLQELPDPVSKVTWDNYAAIAPKMATELNITEGTVIRINGNTEVPVLIQPGQPQGVIAIALGYGRQEAGKACSGIGVNAYNFVGSIQGFFAYALPKAVITKTARTHIFAQTQMHHSLEGRPIVRETTLEEWTANPAAGNEMHESHESKHTTLYPPVEHPVHHWGMVIDLNACTGCSACVVACQAENNVAVVGKEEIKRKRSMHWMRIDRYYEGDPESPAVVYQPLMCQHCDNAPCENVCPVAATTHSAEGLNQMAYSRCIGTKYCINNCPYKVRRFNWFRYVDNEAFPYGTENTLGKMVLNPDVVVRERGVVEKCSLCSQRIQASKLQAKFDGRVLEDGDTVPACAQACPAQAIIFGDLNQQESMVTKAMKDPRNYHILEELHTLPNIGYLTRVRNQEPADKKTQSKT